MRIITKYFKTLNKPNGIRLAYTISMTSFGLQALPYFTESGQYTWTVGLLA